MGAHGVGAVVRNSVGNTTILFLGKNYQAQRIIMTVIVVAVIRHLVRRVFVGVGVRRIVASVGDPMRDKALVTKRFKQQHHIDCIHHEWL